jgi:hypothetical protein
MGTVRSIQNYNYSNKNKRNLRGTATMEIDLTNVAYTKEYQEYQKNNEQIFCAEYFEGKEKIELSEKYDIEKSYYVGEFDYVISGTENCLMDKEGNILYTYRNINDDAEFCTIIYHRDGNEYMIFRSELYGYSVLNLDTLKDFHYVPSQSFKVQGGETFIWTEIFYNNINNILAVSGCYWACPYSIVLVDCSEPMLPGIKQIDIHDKLDSNYEKYDDIDFVKWNNTDLVLKALNAEIEKDEEIIIRENEYINWIKGDI